MNFAEFRPGQVLTYGPDSVSEAEILAFAREYDPQWFHADPVRAKNSRWNGLIASGWQTCGIAMRLDRQRRAPRFRIVRLARPRIPEVARTGARG